MVGAKSNSLIENLEKDRIWCINRDYLGMRKNEIMNLRARDIREIGDRVEIHYIGKGGKHNRQIFTMEREKEYVLSLKKGKEPNERIFDKQEVKKSKNFHKATYYKTIGRRTGRVYEDTKDTVNDRWEREARKSYEENKAKGKLGYLKMNFRLHYCLLTEMSTGKQLPHYQDMIRIHVIKNI